MGIEITSRMCIVEGCRNRRIDGHYCGKHYGRWRRNGHPLKLTRAEIGEGIRWLQQRLGTDSDECIIWPFGGGPYGNTVLDGQGMTATRAMTILAHGQPPEDKPESAHSCGRGHEGCVNPNHLRWASTAENAEDAKIHRMMGIPTANRNDRVREGALRRERVRRMGLT